MDLANFLLCHVMILVTGNCWENRKIKRIMTNQMNNPLWPHYGLSGGTDGTGRMARGRQLWCWCYWLKDVVSLQINTEIGKSWIGWIGTSTIRAGRTPVPVQLYSRAGHTIYSRFLKKLIILRLIFKNSSSSPLTTLKRHNTWGTLHQSIKMCSA